MVAEKGLEPHDLRVMSPTSYQLLHSAILGNHLLITVLLYAITGRLSTLFFEKIKNYSILRLNAVHGAISGG